MHDNITKKSCNIGFFELWIQLTTQPGDNLYLQVANAVHFILFTTAISFLISIVHLPFVYAFANKLGRSLVEQRDRSVRTACVGHSIIPSETEAPQISIICTSSNLATSHKETKMI